LLSFLEIAVSEPTFADEVESPTARVAERSTVHCPTCNAGHPYRIKRRGWIRRKFLPFFGYYPWFCPLCKKSFVMRRRYSERYSRNREY
jgi:hypothetical protein